MLNKEQLLSELTQACKDNNIPHHLIHISHGAAAVINGLRETTSDIDVAVMSANIWANLFSKYGDKNHIRYDPLGFNCGANVIRVGNVDFHWMDEIDISVDVYECLGFFVSSNKQILIERIKLGRDKDRAEASQLIEAYYDQLPQYLKDRYFELCWDRNDKPNPIKFIPV